MIQIGEVYPEDYSDPLYAGTVKIYRHMGLVTNEDTNYQYNNTWYNDYLPTGAHIGEDLYAEPMNNYIAGVHFGISTNVVSTPNILMKVLDVE